MEEIDKLGESDIPVLVDNGHNIHVQPWFQLTVECLSPAEYTYLHHLSMPRLRGMTCPYIYLGGGLGACSPRNFIFKTSETAF